MSLLIQPSFAGGEISSDVYSRVDIAKYNVALRISENGFIRAQGGWSNRAGLEFVTPAKFQNRFARLIGFQFNTLQTYQLEMGHQYMRVIKDGSLVLEALKNITAVTQANPAVVTSNAHGYTNGKWVYIAGVGGMTQLNGKFYEIANVTANTYELRDVFGTPINSTGYGAYTAGGTGGQVYEIVTPYVEADLPLLDFVQKNDVMTLCHPLYDPRELTRTGHNAWTLTVITFAPQNAAPGSVVATATVATGTGLVTQRYVVTAVANETSEESLPSAAGTCSNNLSTAGNYNTITWAAVANTAKYYVYKESNNSGVYGYVGTATNLSFTDQNIKADETDTPPGARNPLSGAGNFPATATYHEQRRVFGYTVNNPQTVYSTQSGNYKNLNVSSPANDSDAWTFAVDSDQVNAIRYLVSLNNLLVFTSGGEFVFKPGANGDTITPSSIAVKSESRFGSAQVKPVIIGKTVLFAESSQATAAKDNGYSVRDLGYTYATDDYNGNDLTILARHLFEFDRLVQWAYAKRPYGILWGVREDGVCCALTYLKEHEVWAWHRHVTDGYFLSVSAIPENGEDSVYFLVERTINGQVRKYIERIHSRRFRNVEDAFFVDSGLTLDNWNSNTANTMTLTGGALWDTTESLNLNSSAGVFTAPMVGQTIFLRTKARNGVIIDTGRVTITAYLNANNVTVSPVSLIPVNVRGVATSQYAFTQATISGLSHLEGKTVAILADGSVEEPAVVVGGAITLPQPVAKAHVGLPYNSDFQTLAIAGDVSKGSLLGQQVNVGKVQLVVQEARGIRIGPNANRLYDVPQRQFENWSEATRLKTGVVETQCEGDWADGSFLVRQSDPLPLTILAVIPDVQIGRS